MADSSPITNLRETFQSPFEQLADRVGQPFELLYAVTEENYDPDVYDVEVLPMYRIKFEDGFETDAWPEEIDADEIWQPNG